MSRHKGLLVDVRDRTHRDRAGNVAPLREMVSADGALYIAGGWVPPHPRFRAYQRWLLPAQGWVVGRFTVHPGQTPMRCDWYIDIDRTTVSGDHWHAPDHLLDVLVFEGVRYEVQDADELAECLERGEIDPATAIAALRSLDALCRSLERLAFSVPALLAEVAPGLTRFARGEGPVRDP